MAWTSRKTITNFTTKLRFTGTPRDSCEIYTFSVTVYWCRMTKWHERRWPSLRAAVSALQPSSPISLPSSQSVLSRGAAPSLRAAASALQPSSPILLLPRRSSSSRGAAPSLPRAAASALQPSSPILLSLSQSVSSRGAVPLARTSASCAASASPQPRL